MKHWLEVFTDCIERSATKAHEAPAPNQQQVLFAYVSADVYEFIEDYESHDATIAKLKTIFILGTKTIAKIETSIIFYF